MSYCADNLVTDGQTHAHTHAGNDNTRRPKLASGKKRKMYAIKQIKICAEYRDMLPRPRLDLSGTPGVVIIRAFRNIF